MQQPVVLVTYSFPVESKMPAKFRSIDGLRMSANFFLFYFKFVVF